MARKISFTKAEMEAVRFFLREHEDHWTQVADEARYKADSKRIRAVLEAARSLLAKMDEPEQAKVLGEQDGVAASEFCSLLSPCVVLPQTRASWAMLQKAISAADWTIEEVKKLDLTWARKPIPAFSVATKGKDWLARQRATPILAHSSAPADLEFDDE